MTRQQLLAAAIAALRSTSPTAQFDAEQLLAHCLDCKVASLYAHPERAVEAMARQQFQTLLQQRANGQPVAYLLAQQGFWDINLQVTEAVLIPRPATETLVELALARLANAPTRARVLDLGTGSGAIALAVAKVYPQAQVVATDCSSAALAVAATNQQRLKLSNITWHHGDWFAAVPPDTAAFDVIVSNPPYIDAESPFLQQGDVRFEPQTALVADQQGLACLRTIIANAAAWLKPGGMLAVEHGFDQQSAVQQLFAAAGFVDIQGGQDLDGLPRCVWGGRSIY